MRTLKILKRLKRKFSPSWKSSKKPSKQRKYRANAPLHIKGKFLHVHLSKELREKYGIRSIRVRKNDKVKILVGDFKGTEGIVEKVDLKKSKIFVRGAHNIKNDGSKSLRPIDPSNVMIIELDTSDKKRFKKSNENKKSNKKSEEKTE